MVLRVNRRECKAGSGRNIFMRLKTAREQGKIHTYTYIHDLTEARL